MKKLFAALLIACMSVIASAADTSYKSSGFAPAQLYHDNGNGTYSMSVANAPASITDRSGTITSGGAAQVAIPANAGRRKWRIQNTETNAGRQEVLWVRDDGGTASAGAGSYALAPSSTGAGGYIEGESTGAISVFAATTGHSFSASEY